MGLRPTHCGWAVARFISVVMWCVIGLAGQAMPARAGLDPALSQLCYQAIARNAKRMNVPVDVMLAISLTETGRKLDGQTRPWPWTVNMQGTGKWFETRGEALAYVKAHFARGARSFDVGCFQINYKWHHQHFRSIEDMFDPNINAAYAAKFLSDLFREKGSWSLAAGAFHSRTPEYANRYRKRFDRYRARISGAQPDLDIAEGHGSEPIRLASAEVPSAPQEQPRRVQPLFDIGRRAPLTSSGQRPLGSLAAIDGSGTGLLRPSNGSLY